MNYDQEITKLINEIKADKSIIQPWRNKAAARLEEVQAFVRMGRGTSNLQAPFPVHPGQINGRVQGCNGNCDLSPNGLVDGNCPVHGL